MKKNSWLLLLLMLEAAALSAEPFGRPKVGLVLSGGGAKGFAHIGAIKMIDSLNIPIDYIAGTSMGGIIGGLYAIGYSGAELEKMAQRSDWGEIFTDTPPRPDLPYFEKEKSGRYQISFGLQGLKPVPPSGLIYGQKVSLLLSELFFPYDQTDHFDQLPIPFRCVAVDLVTGEDVVLGAGSLTKAIRATMSIPTVFSPVEWGDSLLVDGGLNNNLPVDVVKRMGAEIVIAVDVQSPLLSRDKLTSAVTVLQQTVNLVGLERWRQNLEMVDVIIRPDISSYTAADFQPAKIGRILRQGKLAADEALPSLLALQKKYALYRPAGAVMPKRVFNKNPLISGIQITDHQKLPFSFIYRLLGLQPGGRLDTGQLNHNIMDLYGLGYFESLTYEVIPVDSHYVDLHFHACEKSFRQLRLGLRYDDRHKLVAALHLQATNLPVPGFRFENEVQFAGLTRLWSRASYPSRALNLPVYPFAHVLYKDIPIHLFDDSGQRIAEYPDRSISFGGGIGMVLGKSWNASVAYQQERMDIEPNVARHDPSFSFSWHHRLRTLESRLTIDRLDDVLLPRNGLNLKVEHVSSMPELATDVNFQQLSLSLDLYRTVHRRHTWRGYAFWGWSSMHVPVYKYFNQGRPHFFVGMNDDQLACPDLSIVRMDYRYEHKPDIFFLLIANLAFEVHDPSSPIYYGKNILQGAGLGIRLLSPVGPLEAVVGRGERGLSTPGRMQTRVYVTLGFRF